MAAMDRGRSRSQSGSFSFNDDDKTVTPINYVFTRSEVRAIQRTLGKIGVGRSSYPPATPRSYSVPTTPTVLIPPNVYASWLDDEYLPLTSRKAIRGFLFGVTGNAAVQGLLPALMGRKSFKDFLKSFTSAASAKAGAALALYVSIYRTVLQVLLMLRAKKLIPQIQAWEAKQQQQVSTSKPSSSKRVIVPEEPSNRQRAQIYLLKLLQSTLLAPFVAANIAVPALVLLPQGFRRYISLDILVRALQYSYEEAERRKSRLVSWMPSWMGGALLYALGNGQLLYAFLFEPEAFPKSYGKVILARSGAYVPARPDHLPADVPWPSRREIANTVAQLSTPSKNKAPYPSFNPPLLAALNPLPFPTSNISRINPVLDYSPAHPAHTNLLCAVLHPTQPSCQRNFVDFWKQEWVGSARFVAVFAALAQLLNIKKVLRDPETAIFRYGMAVLQGATVISGSIGTAWAMTCFWQHYLPRTFLPRLRYFLSGVISSIFILAVPPARRTELGLYVAKMSTRSSWQMLHKRKLVRSPPYGEMLLLGLGLGLLSSMYEENPKALSKSMRALFRWGIGARQGGVGAVTVGQQTSGGMDNSYFFAREKLKAFSSIHPEEEEKDQDVVDDRKSRASKRRSFKSGA